MVAGRYIDSDADSDSLPYYSFHAYPTLLKGGYDGQIIGSAPFTIKPRMGLPVMPYSENFRFDVHGTAYDYIVTGGEKSSYQAIGYKNWTRAPLVAMSGGWRLYRVGP
jgi:hypothetical protein